MDDQGDGRVEIAPVAMKILKERQNLDLFASEQTLVMSRPGDETEHLCFALEASKSIASSSADEDEDVTPPWIAFPLAQNGTISRLEKSMKRIRNHYIETENKEMTEMIHVAQDVVWLDVFEGVVRMLHTQHTSLL